MPTSAETVRMGITLPRRVIDQAATDFLPPVLTVNSSHSVRHSDRRQGLGQRPITARRDPGLDAFQIALGHESLIKALTGSLTQSLFTVVDRTQLAGQADLAEGHQALRQRLFPKRGLQ